MEIGSRRPHVVAAHFFAKYGYDGSLEQVSSNLGEVDEMDFWREVVDILDELKAREDEGLHPCAALPPARSKPLFRNRRALLENGRIRYVSAKP